MTKARTTSGVAGMVAAARAAKGWTLRETAERAGCSPSFLCDVELGRRLPSVGTVAALEHVLGVDAAAMITGIVEQKLAAARKR